MPRFNVRVSRVVTRREYDVLEIEAPDAEDARTQAEDQIAEGNVDWNCHGDSQTETPVEYEVSSVTPAHSDGDG